MIEQSDSPMIFKPKPKENEDYVGNFRTAYSDKIYNFMNKYFDRFVISIESKGEDNEHCHFWAQGPLIKKSEKTRDNLAKYIRNEFPDLKRKTKDDKGNTLKGGSNLYNIKIMKDIFQFYYIFKEGIIASKKAVIIKKKTLKYYIKQYNYFKKAKQSGKAGEFHLHLLKKMPKECLKKRNVLIEEYILWCKDKGGCPTINLCDRYVNHILAIYDTNTLIDNFQKIISNKYNREYN